jgi:hypothetical protein
MKQDLQNLDYCNEALKIEYNLRKGFLVLAEYLYTIRKDELHKPQWETFYEYCLEFKELSPSKISKLISVYEKFIIEFGFPRGNIQGVGWTQLYAIISRCNTKKGALEWLELAKTLTRNDLNRSLIEEKTGVDMSKCKHQDSYIIRICRTCGNKEQVI